MSYDGFLLVERLHDLYLLPLVGLANVRKVQENTRLLIAQTVVHAVRDWFALRNLVWLILHRNVALLFDWNDGPRWVFPGGLVLQGHREVKFLFYQWIVALPWEGETAARASRDQGRCVLSKLLGIVFDWCLQVLPARLSSIEKKIFCIPWLWRKHVGLESCLTERAVQIRGNYSLLLVYLYRQSGFRLDRRGFRILSERGGPSVWNSGLLRKTSFMLLAFSNEKS